MKSFNIDGQFSLFDFFEDLNNDNFKSKIYVNRSVPILNCHPRTIETFRQIANLDNSKKSVIAHQYNINPYDLNELALVCKNVLGVGHRFTLYGVVDHNDTDWFYRFKSAWEGVYVIQLSWREFARYVVCLIEENLWFNFLDQSIYEIY